MFFVKYEKISKFLKDFAWILIVKYCPSGLGVLEEKIFYLPANQKQISSEDVLFVQSGQNEQTL